MALRVAGVQRHGGQVAGAGLFGLELGDVVADAALAHIGCLLGAGDPIVHVGRLQRRQHHVLSTLLPHLDRQIHRLGHDAPELGLDLVLEMGWWGEDGG